METVVAGAGVEGASAQRRMWKEEGSGKIPGRSSVVVTMKAQVESFSITETHPAPGGHHRELLAKPKARENHHTLKTSILREALSQLNRQQAAFKRNHEKSTSKQELEDIYIP